MLRCIIVNLGSLQMAISVYSIMYFPCIKKQGELVLAVDCSPGGH